MILNNVCGAYICMLKNYYKILNLDFNASLAEVKTAYRKLALLYHPDKTDNELLKARFAEVKEAYEILSHPAKRKNYDLTFDNFSYKKDVQLTPYQILQKINALKIKTGQLDPHRIDLDKLEFDITELLSERNTDTLIRTQDRQIVQQVIEAILVTAKPLSPKQFRPIINQLLPMADDTTREKIRTFLHSHSWDNRWNNYKIVVAVIGGIILCLLIYFIARQGQ
jgi:DnaJ-domain-containing protein 1